MYCVYIIRISITDVEYNIIANVDADTNSSLDYINNLLLQKYVDNITSSFNFVYSTAEINKAKEFSKSVKPVVTPVVTPVMTHAVPIVPSIADVASVPIVPSVPSVPSIVDVPSVPSIVDEAAVAAATAVANSDANEAIGARGDIDLSKMRKAFARGDMRLFNNDGELNEDRNGWVSAIRTR
jgi:methyl coenzyme M reductase alpha subunit